MRKNELYQKEYKSLKTSRIRLMQIILLIAYLLFLLSLYAKGQNNKSIQSNALIAEKVYLQLDKKVYTTGSMVWFKSIVLSAFSHVPSSLSGVLYVELINPNEDILEKK